MRPRLIIYIAKGPPDACGRGCDRWIAVEGQVDSGAAPRVPALPCRESRTRNLPDLFPFAGRHLDQALAIGRLLREKPVIARVGRTMVSECGFEAPRSSDACLKIKRSGGEVDGELWTRNAMCNSACSYLFLGATTREIAPDAVLAVTFAESGGAFQRPSRPARQMRAAATGAGTSAPTAMRAAYHRPDGHRHRELDDLIKTVKFERHSCPDPRGTLSVSASIAANRVETPWIFENLRPQHDAQVRAVQGRRRWIRFG